MDALTSQVDGTATLDDEDLLARATHLGRILVTQDHDFLRIAAEWQATGRPFVGILFLRQVGVSLGRLIDDAHLVLDGSDPAELRDRVTYLPLS